jgi:hypothetical protein
VNARKGSTKKEHPKSDISPEAPKGNPEEIKYVFKSKFKRDKVLLDAGYRRTNDDGSKSIKNDVWAEFEHHTWITKDPALAEFLRRKIKTSKDVGPLHIMETTNI